MNENTLPLRSNSHPPIPLSRNATESRGKSVRLQPSLMNPLPVIPPNKSYKTPLLPIIQQRAYTANSISSPLRHRPPSHSSQYSQPPGQTNMGRLSPRRYQARMENCHRLRAASLMSSIPPIESYDPQWSKACPRAALNEYSSILRRPNTKVSHPSPACLGPIAASIPTPAAKVNIVVVGDENCGKSTFVTGFLSSMATKTCRAQKIHQTIQIHEQDVSVSPGETVQLVLWDFPGHESFDRLRPLGYTEADVAIICFDVNDRTSFESVIRRWKLELDIYSPGVPVVLVGLKTDIRGDENRIARTEACQLSDLLLPRPIYFECCVSQNLEKLFPTFRRIVSMGMACDVGSISPTKPLRIKKQTTTRSQRSTLPRPLKAPEAPPTVERPRPGSARRRGRSRSDRKGRCTIM